jgi:hypothetical protein
VPTFFAPGHGERHVEIVKRHAVIAAASTKLPGWESWKTLVSDTAYHSFAGEVEALNTPTIRIAKARNWIDDLAYGRVASFAVIARREGKIDKPQND